MNLLKTLSCLLLLLFPIHNTETLPKTCEEAITEFSGEYTCAVTKQRYFGKGANAITFIVNKKGSRVKFILKASQATQGHIKHIRDYKYIERLKDNPYVIRRYAAVFKKHIFYEILEFGANGALHDYIKKFNFKTDQRFILFLFNQILTGAIGMHENRIVHTDLKPDNIVITESNIPKIIDFDLALDLKEHKAGRGTDDYMAPEVIDKYNKRIKFTEKQDYWSLGVILYYMMFHTVPFKAENKQKILRNIKRGTFKVYEGTSYEIVDIMLSLLKYNENDRIDLKEVQNKVKEYLSFKEWTLFVGDRVLSIFETKQSKLQDKIYKANNIGFLNKYGRLMALMFFLFVLIPIGVFYLTKTVKDEIDEYLRRTEFEDRLNN